MSGALEGVGRGEHRMNSEPLFLQSILTGMNHLSAPVRSLSVLFKSQPAINLGHMPHFTPGKPLLQVALYTVLLQLESACEWEAICLGLLMTLTGHRLPGRLLSFCQNPGIPTSKLSPCSARRLIHPAAIVCFACLGSWVACWE